MNLGQLGEELAAKEYEKRGYKIIGRNVRLHGYRQVGEIDLIAIKDKELVFIEVKTRRSKRFGEGAEAVGYLKQRRLRHAVKLYLLQRPQYDDWSWRIDVVQCDVDNRENPAIILVNAIEDD